MATFLELCATLARESGAIGPAPATTVGALPRRQAQCVGWIREAWNIIQNAQPDWRWLRAEFEGDLVAGKNSYSAFDLGIQPRFAEWVQETARHPVFSVYNPANGRKDEQWLRQLDYVQWRQSFGFGVHDATRPTYWAIGFDNLLRIGQTPDLAYKVRGEYRKTPQVLAADTDVPEMPARFHSAIWQRAIMLMAASDEAVQSLQTATVEFSAAYRDMARDLLPPVTMNSPALDRR